MLELEREDMGHVDWEALDSLPDRVLFQTRAWLAFLEDTQGGEPVVARVRDGASTVGWFTGVVFTRLGVRILGSPFPGWTTASMGFNLDEGVPRRAAVEALLRFAWRDLACMHVELKDRELGADDVRGLGFHATRTVTYEVDLTADEDELLRRMSQMARRNIRKAAKGGLVVEQAPAEGFADLYHEQLVDVYARQGLKPSYGPERVRSLVARLHPTGNLLLLRTVASSGAVVATGIFPGFNGVCYFWGGASPQQYLALKPNETLFWEGMRRWRARGMATLDTGGGGEYKLKYGVRNEVNVPHLRQSRVRALGLLRDAAAHVAALRQRQRPFSLSKSS